MVAHGVGSCSTIDIQRRPMMAICPTAPDAAALFTFCLNGVRRRLRLLRALEDAFHARVPLAIATVLEGAEIGKRCFAGPTVAEHLADEPAAVISNQHWGTWLFRRCNACSRLTSASQSAISATRVWVDYRSARPGLWVFGAGDDARPIVHLARQLGWFVAVADGRSHLATRSRFPAADSVLILPAQRRRCRLSEI